LCTCSHWLLPIFYASYARASSVNLFFLQGYGAPPNLHSFPTRRSSDLQFKGRQGGIPIFDCRREFRRNHPARRGFCFEQRLQKSDRKSTRLNSSHDQISYAVFCLKKKNRTTL